MKPLEPETLIEAEHESREWWKELKAFRTYQGSNKMYETKAKIGISAISAFARMRSSESNREAVELAAERMAGIPHPDRVLTLPGRTKRR